jgi:adenosylhomocysteine nucleosidase
MESGTGDPVWHLNAPAARVAVIAALELEARILRRILPPASCLLTVSGPGRERAARAARAALEQGAGALVSWGLAGGLAAGAGTGSVLLPDRVLAADGAWPTDPAWRRRLEAVLGPDPGVLSAPLYTAARVVTGAAAKAALAASTGAAAVDLESAGIAEVAAAAGRPFVAIRVVADGPDASLPDGVERLITAGGRLRLAGLPAMLASPRRLRQLLALGRQSRTARAVLARLAASLAGTAA